MFSLAYYGIGIIVYIAMIPVLLLLSLKKKYRLSIPSRFFLYCNPPFTREGIWFHACSLGEVKSLQPLLGVLSQPVNLSVITNTGYDAAKMHGVQRRFLPFEIFLPFWVHKQKVLVVLEAELWYMLFFSAKRNGMKTYLLNARISDRSYPRYRKFSWFYRHLFANVDIVFAQSEKDKIRLESLGAADVRVSGNIKAYQDISPSRSFAKPSKEVITLASTHEGEEALLLEHLHIEKNRMMIVVPRHPERFDKVDRYLKDFAQKRGLGYHRFSDREDFGSDIVLVDKMGELINIYAISDVVLLGGSFVSGIGGHNPLEPAYFHTKIISGESVFNQEALFPMVDHVNFCDPSDLEKTIRSAKPSKINTKVDMMPIIEELKSVV